MFTPRQLMVNQPVSPPDAVQVATLLQQLTGRGRNIADSRVIRAMTEVPRHEFVPENLREKAYGDSPLPVGFGQTISQPYVVAFMTQALRLKPTDRVLEIGVGCGYQTAVLSRLAARVYGMEIVESLAKQATATLHRLGVANATIRAGDGYLGWPEEAPFDAVLAACASDHVPLSWLEQLRPGGRMVLPMGDPVSGQDLWLLEKSCDSVSRRTILPVRFVPMTGEASRK